MGLLWITFLASLIAVSKCLDENSEDIFDTPFEGDLAESTDLKANNMELNEGLDTFEISTAVIEPTIDASNTTQAVKSEENVPVEALELTTRLTDSSSQKNERGKTPPDVTLRPIIQLVVGDETEPLQTTTRSTFATTQPLPEEVMVADPFTITEPAHVIGTTTALEVPVDIQSTTQTHPQTEAKLAIVGDKTKAASPLQVPTANIVPTDTPILPHQLTLEQRVLKEKERMLELSQSENKDLNTKYHLEAEPTIDEGITRVVEALVTVVTENTTENINIVETSTSRLMEKNVELAITAISTTESTTGKAMTKADDLNKMVREDEKAIKPVISGSTTEGMNVKETVETDGDAEPFDQEKFSGLFEPDGSVIPTDHVLNQHERPAFPIVHLPDDKAEKEHVEMQINQTTVTLSPVTQDLITEATANIMWTSSEAPTTLDAEVRVTTDTAETLTTEELSSMTTAVEHLHEPLNMNSQPSVVETTKEDTIAHIEEPEHSLEEHEHMIRLPEFRPQSELDPMTDVEHSSLLMTKQVDDLKKSTLTMRITSIDYIEEFADKESGKYKKLNEQISPEISAILNSILGKQFAGFEIRSFSKGSVVVNGIILTNSDIQDAEDLATKIETVISSNGSTIGGNDVDSRSITVNDIPSRAYINKVHSSHMSSSSSTLLIGTIIVVGVVVILIVAVIIIVMNNRRSNGTMKLRDDHLQRLESGKVSYANPQAVNLMTYANGGAPPSPSSQPPMVTSLSVNAVEREVS